MIRKSIVLGAAISLGMACATSFAAEVTVSVGDPGYYGRLEIAGAPKPVLISPDPVVIQRERVIEQPTYVYVPVEQRNDWANSCAKYDACARPVYFVEERWYKDVYVPHYKSAHEIRKDAKQEYREAKREAKEIKREAKEEYKDTKRQTR